MGRASRHSFGFNLSSDLSVFRYVIARPDATRSFLFDRYFDFLNFEAENSLTVRMRATTIREKTTTPVKKRMSSVI